MFVSFDRLVELGPRLTLELFKIEEGIMAGEVMFHSLVKKTQSEVQDLKRQKQQKTALKLSRKKQQELKARVFCQWSGRDEA